MGVGQYKQQGVRSKLLPVPPTADVKQIAIVIEQNFDIIWRALNDLRNRVDTLQNK